MRQLLLDLLRQDFPEAARLEVHTMDNKARVEIVDTIFADKSRVQRHQLVYKALAGHLASGELHAVQIVTLAPNEV